MNIESLKLQARYKLADEAWRKINHKYEAYSSDQFLIMFELYIEAYLSGFEEGLDEAEFAKSFS